MRIAVTGSTGLVGSALVSQLRSSGHEVIRLVRNNIDAQDEVLWDPISGAIDMDKLAGIDAAVHLAGVGIADHRWTDNHKQQVLSSRVSGTTTLSECLSKLHSPPTVLVSASAVGYYGDRGEEVLTEESPAGLGFLADLCVRWESATSAASSAGIRVVLLRTGVVLTSAGGALVKQMTPFKLGLGGTLGNGRQYLSWISRRDVVDAISFLLLSSDAAGPFNVTAPNPVTNATFTKSLGHALNRPAILRVPKFALQTAFGTEMAAEFLLASQRAVPKGLLDAGFVFSDPELEGALRMALSRH